MSEFRRPISRREALGGITALTTLAIGTYAQARRPPNLVFFLTDDMGYADLGCFGAKDIQTPHIDSLARDGVKLTDCYANAPVCTPTRVGFLTGRYQQRFGPDLEWALGPANNKTAGLRPEDSVLPSALKKRGYRCGMFGKWHVGWQPPFRPNAHGFDEFYGILLGNVDMYTHRYHDGSLDLWHNGKPQQDKGYLTELLAGRAVEWLQQNAQQPFFLYMPFNAPHWPFQPPGQTEAATGENWRDGERRDYARMVEAVDTAVGRVLEAIRRMGAENNTLVVFTNDNGGERLSDNGPFFHVKGTVFEGGIRVPGLAKWPGVIPPGSVSSQVCATMDFTASFLKAAGAQPRDGVQLDGVDILDVLAGKTPEFERPLYWRIYQNGRRQFAVRKGRWKLIDDNTGNRGFPELLFDIAADPAERRNLFYNNQAIAAGLRRDYLQWEAGLPQT